MATEPPVPERSRMAELLDMSPEEVAKKLSDKVSSEVRFDLFDKWLRANAAFAYWPVSIALAAGLVLYLHFGPVQFSWTETFWMFVVLCPAFIFFNAARVAGYRDAVKNKGDD